MSLQLYSGIYDIGFRANKILVAAKYAGVDVQPAKDFKNGETNETQAYALNCSPLMRVPVLQTPEGYLFESGAILRHIARLDKTSGLYGRTLFENAQVDQWIDFGTSELDAHLGSLLFDWIAGGVPAERVTACKEAISTALAGLDTWLEIRSFLVGERISAADIAVATSVHAIFRVFDQFKKLVNLNRWYATISNQPHFVATIKQGLATTRGMMAQGGAAKPAAAAKEAPKKEEKPAKKDAHEEAADLMDEAEEAPKAKNPLDLLPPSPFVLDAFKREYSNKDTRKEAAPFFFQNYDPAGYSCYYCKYKYNNELKMQFMTANLIRGWFQRMDRLHKYAFGCVLINGEDSNHEVVGFWVFRGKGLPEVLLEVDDVEHYEWTEIPDINAEKEHITDIMCWEGPTIKKPVLEGRVFK